MTQFFQFQIFEGINYRVAVGKANQWLAETRIEPIKWKFKKDEESRLVIIYYQTEELEEVNLAPETKVDDFIFIS